MPVGYGTQCSACNSQHREEIDRRLLAGASTRDVSAWLAQQGETLGKSGLARHKAEHLNVLEEAKARLSSAEAAKVVAAVNKRGGAAGSKAKRKAAISVADGIKAVKPFFEAAVERVVADATLLDEIASISIHVARQLVSIMANPTQAQAAAFGDALRHARGAVTDRHELLHGKKVQVEGDGGNAAALAELIAAAKTAAEANAKAGPEESGDDGRGD